MAAYAAPPSPAEVVLLDVRDALGGHPTCTQQHRALAIANRLIAEESTD